MKSNGKREFYPDIICFIIVSLIAIPVTILRSRTFEIGYELATIKDIEKSLKRKNLELKVQLSSLKKQVRENLTKNNHQFYYPKFKQVELYENFKELYTQDKRKINNKDGL